MDRNYKVYVHISPYGKRYYGITGESNVNKRWKNGKGYKNNNHFWNSICKYGWDNFTHEILFDNLTEEEAKLLEQMYIALYDTRNPNCGYNYTKGGDDNPMNNEEIREKVVELCGKKIYIIELDMYFDSVTEASKIIGCTKNNISSVLNGKSKTAGGYHWIYANEVENNKVS